MHICTHQQFGLKTAANQWSRPVGCGTAGLPKWLHGGTCVLPHEVAAVPLSIFNWHVGWVASTAILNAWLERNRQGFHACGSWPWRLKSRYRDYEQNDHYQVSIRHNHLTVQLILSHKCWTSWQPWKQFLCIDLLLLFVLKYDIIYLYDHIDGF
jgi:hypothetical protein